MKLTLLLLLLTFNIFGQKGYKIEGQILNHKPGKLYRGHYFGSDKSVVYKDTAIITTLGKFIFYGKNDLVQGLYFLEFQSKRRCEIVIDQSQKIQVELNYLNPSQNFKVNGSSETVRYHNYLTFVRPRQEKLKRKLTSTDFAITNSELSEFQQKFFSENQGSLSYNLLAASELPFTPNFTLANGKLDTIKRFYHYKNHLFDNMNLNDERLLKSPFLQPRLSEYIEKLTVQSPDSLVFSFDLLMLKTKAQAIRKYFINFVLSHLQKNPFIGADNAWVYIVDKYYLAEPSLWDEVALKQTKHRAEVLRPLILGAKFPDITLEDNNGKIRKLSEIKAKYTIVYFYSLDCPHCQEHAPKLAAFQKKMKDVMVYAVSVENDEKKWRNFIKQYHTENLINVIDKKDTIDFQNKFDVLEYPTNYILDQEMRIIGKKINPNLFEAYFKYLEKR